MAGNVVRISITPNELYFILIIFVLVMLVPGIYFLYRSIKKDHEMTISFVSKIFTGIVGGIIVAMLIEVRRNSGNWLLYLITFGLIILIMGLVSYMMTFHLPKKPKEKEQEHKDKHQS